MSGVSQLRTYTLKEGKLDEFVKAWSESIYPLRLQHGFKVDGAWVIRDDNKFVWILTYDGPGDWDARNKAYHESPERKALNPDPVQLIANIEAKMLTPILPLAHTGKPDKGDSHDARLQQARHLISQRDHKGAHEALLEYLKEHPNDAEAWYLIGQSAGDNAEAKTALEKALELDPDHEEASVLLASLKGEAEIITYPTRPNVDMAALAAQRKAEREAKEAAEKKDDGNPDG
jgi:tetratricopeptide (TPR) repeat protein